MTIVVSDYIDVKQRASDLGCNLPTEVSLLPKNFETAATRNELVHEDTAPTVRALLRKAGVSETKLEKEGEKYPYSLQESFDWVAPILFISASWLSQNSDLISVSLGVISNYLTDFFKGISGPTNVKLSVVVETTPNRRYKKLVYEGPPDQVKELESAIRGVLKSE